MIQPYRSWWPFLLSWFEDLIPSEDYFTVYHWDLEDVSEKSNFGQNVKYPSSTACTYSTYLSRYRLIYLPGLRHLNYELFKSPSIGLNVIIWFDRYFKKCIVHSLYTVSGNGIRNEMISIFLTQFSTKMMSLQHRDISAASKQNPLSYSTKVFQKKSAPRLFMLCLHTSQYCLARKSSVNLRLVLIWPGENLYQNQNFGRG